MDQLIKNNPTRICSQFMKAISGYRQILTLAFSVIFLIQLGHLTSKYVEPTELNTVMEIVKKDQLEFPLLFQFCLRPGFNMTELKKHGYINLDFYFWGTTDWTDEDVGWGGINGSLTPEGNALSLLPWLNQ